MEVRGRLRCSHLECKNKLKARLHGTYFFIMTRRFISKVGGCLSNLRFLIGSWGVHLEI